MTLSKTQAVILEMGVEDLYDLYEVVWALRTTMGDSGSQALVERARSDIKCLMREGLISLFLRTSDRDLERTMSDDEAIAALDEEDR